MGKRRRFTNEFKFEAVQLAERGDTPVAQVARKYPSASLCACPYETACQPSPVKCPGDVGLREGTAASAVVALAGPRSTAFRILGPSRRRGVHEGREYDKGGRTSILGSR
jgi:hypothetical protein